MASNDLLTQSVVVAEKREATKKYRQRGAAQPVTSQGCFFITDKPKRTTDRFSVALTLPRRRWELRKNGVRKNRRREKKEKKREGQRILVFAKFFF
jgi:hypothetical protein